MPSRHRRLCPPSGGGATARQSICAASLDPAFLTATGAGASTRRNVRSRQVLPSYLATEARGSRPGIPPRLPTRPVLPSPFVASQGDDRLSREKLSAIPHESRPSSPRFTRAHLPIPTLRTLAVLITGRRHGRIYAYHCRATARARTERRRANPPPASLADVVPDPAHEQPVEDERSTTQYAL